MALVTRTDLENLERSRLAPYAAFASQSRGRKYSEAPSTYRTDFQRDRDRILHSAAFRRMEYKTQVFVNHEGDHYRTRLTHTLEVAQIGRTVSRNLLLNEDLTEALILSHDVGHTPFGHSGERVMAGLMKEHGKFEHNRQSLRVVEFLERRYPDFPGLNLTFEVREGIVKHSAHWKPENVPSELEPGLQPPLEAQLIDYVDEIAYNNHDIDDGLKSHLLTYSSLENVTLWKESLREAKKKFTASSIETLKYPIISIIITALVQDLITETNRRLQESRVQKLDEIRKLGKPIATYSQEMSEKSQELKKFLWSHMYTHSRVVRMEEKAKRILTDLFHAYMERPEQIPNEYREQFKNETPARMICDYIAGMTDRFALDEHRKLFDPHEKV